MNMKSTVDNATRAVVHALAPASGVAEETDVLETLKNEHNEVRALLSDLQDAETASRRQKLVKEIKTALVPHAKAEEKVIYDAVVKLKDQDAQVDAHEGYLEHQWASKTLELLESIRNAASPEHKAAGKVLKELLEHHIKEEESNIWRDVKQNFSDEERIKMNVAFLAAKGRVNIA